MQESHKKAPSLFKLDRDGRAFRGPTSSTSKKGQVQAKTRRNWTSRNGRGILDSPRINVKALRIGSKPPKSEASNRPVARRDSYSQVDRDDLQLSNLVRALVQTKIEIYETVLLVRYGAFVQCIKKGRTEVLDPKAVTLHKELMEKKHYDEDSVRRVWFDSKQRRYYKIFHSYLKRWEVESSLEFVTALHQAHLTNQKGNTKSFRKQLCTIIESHFYPDSTLPIHQSRREKVATLFEGLFVAPPTLERSKTT